MTDKSKPCEIVTEELVEVTETRQWRCFHCDELFHDADAARDHFGDQQLETPACQLNATGKGLLGLYRELQREHWRVVSEDTNDNAKMYYAMGADHSRAVRKSEEDGYAKGLKDGRAEAAENRRTAFEEAAKIADATFDEFTDRRDDQLRDLHASAALVHGRQAQTASDIAMAIRAAATVPEQHDTGDRG